MTGNDEGGFSPHPGDPWHPGWHADDEPSDDVPLESGASDDEADDEEKPRRRGLFRRRSRDDSPAAEDEEPASSPAPSDETEAPLPEPLAPPTGDDPFDAVLRAEGRSVRRRPAAETGAPAPDWTSDDEIPDELDLPVAQPSWVGDTTGIDAGVETSEFESTPIEGEPAGEPHQPDLFAPPAGDTPDRAEEAPSVDIPDRRETAEEQPAIAGEYGVAGPEAFDALAETAEEDLGDWEAFMEGTAATPQGPGPDDFGTPAEPVGDVDELDEWIESDPKPKRRWFRRKEDPAGEESSGEEQPEVVEADTEWSDDEWGESPQPAVDTQVWEPGGVPDHSPYMPPMEDDDLVLPATTGEDDDTEADTAAALAEALAALGITEDEQEVEYGDQPAEVAGSAHEVDASDEDAPSAAMLDQPVAEELEPRTPMAAAAPDQDEDEAPAVPPAPMLDDEAAAAPDQDEDEAPAVPTAPMLEVDDAAEEAVIPSVAADPIDDDELVVEEPVDWEGDPSRIPSSWFADVDEDSVVPPPVADTPETEWPQREEGPWEGRAAWQRDEPKEVFDVEAAGTPAPGPEVEAYREPDPEPVVPEGYEDWSSAVADATRDAEDDETAEYHVQHVAPPADALPEGFEPFPGSEAEAAYGEARDDDREDHWMGDTTDEATPVDAGPVVYDPVDDDGVDFDERIYSAGGTVEHRGLAEAIAAVGDEDDTEWQAMSAAMPGVETGVLGFEDVADLAGEEEYVAPVRSNLGVRAVTGVVLAGLLFGSILVGGWAFALFVGALVLLGLGEFFTTLQRMGYVPLSIFGLAGAAGTLAATWFHGPLAIPSGILLTTVVVFFFYAFAPTRRDALSNGGLTVLGVAWATGSIAFAIPIARAPEFEILVLAVVACTAAMDIGAYSFGRRWGRRPLAPILSPNKTVEGLLGGILLTLAAGAAFGYLELGPFDLTAGLALGAVVVVAAPLGDLAESMIKRSMGVKDMGSTLPGHGGVLDRIDAFLFVIPSAWVLYQVLGYLG